MELEGNGVVQADLAGLSNRLRSELFRTGSYTVLERSKMNEILKEQGFQGSGCTNTECAVEVGQLIGVEKIIVGSIDKVGDVFTVNIRLIAVATGKIEKDISEDCDNCTITGVLKTSIPNVALKMAGAVAVTARKPEPALQPPPPPVVMKAKEENHPALPVVAEAQKKPAGDAICPISSNGITVNARKGFWLISELGYETILESGVGLATLSSTLDMGYNPAKWLILSLEASYALQFSSYNSFTGTDSTGMIFDYSATIQYLNICPQVALYHSFGTVFALAGVGFSNSFVLSATVNGMDVSDVTTFNSVVPLNLLIGLNFNHFQPHLGFSRVTDGTVLSAGINAKLFSNRILLGADWSNVTYGGGTHSSKFISFNFAYTGR